MSRLLVVDGEPTIRESIRMILGGAYEVVSAASPEEGASAARRARPDLILVGGPPGSHRRPAGVQSPWLEPLRRLLPAGPRLLSLPLPFSVPTLRGMIRRALAGEPEAPAAAPPEGAGEGPTGGRPAPDPLAARPGLEARAGAAWGGRALREELLRRVLGAADPAGSLIRAATRAAATTLPVLLVGKRGTGRRTLARWIHASGPLRGGPFLAVGCAGLSPAALREELEARPSGAGRPTLFVAGLDDASPALQQALLELLDAGVVRLIASASDALWERVEEGAIAESLVETLGIFTLALPPLRERPAAIAAAAGPLLEWAARESGGRAPRRLSPAAHARLAAYSWPGNLRELACVLVRSAVLATGPVLGPDDIDFGFESTGLPHREGAGAEGHRAADRPQGRDPAGSGGAAAPGGTAGTLPEGAPEAPGRAGTRGLLGPAAGPAEERGGLAVLLAELAHELKNPLVAIRTFTQLLDEKFDDPEFRREFYRVVRRDLERIDHLVEGILHAADAVPRRIATVDLNGLLDEVVVQSEPWMVERRVVAFRDVAEGLPPVLVDPAQARSALFNVIARALASIPQGDDLYLVTRPGPPVQFSISYRDVGPIGGSAIRPGAEELELRLARAALEGAGGRLAVDRQPGGRTTVTIEFVTAGGPRLDEAGSARAAPETESESWRAS